MEAKIFFLFTADDRVDFRELVKELAKEFKKQVQLHQIGQEIKLNLWEGMENVEDLFVVPLGLEN